MEAAGLTMTDKESKEFLQGKDEETTAQYGDKDDEKAKKAKDDEKAIVKPSQKIDESNDTWYNSSLYESLKSKWTK